MRTYLKVLNLVNLKQFPAAAGLKYSRMQIDPACRYLPISNRNAQIDIHTYLSTHSLFSLPHTLMRKEFNKCKSCDARSRFLRGLGSSYTQEVYQVKTFHKFETQPTILTAQCFFFVKLEEYTQYTIVVEVVWFIVIHITYYCSSTLLHLGMKKRISSLVFFWIFCGGALKVHSWEQKPLQCWQCASVPGGCCSVRIILQLGTFSI